MSDPKFKRFIEKCVAVGLERLELTFWRIELEYVEKVEAYDSDEELTFEIEIDHMYMEATISVAPLAYKNWKAGKLEYVARDVLHELVHLITEPLANFAKDRLPKADHEQLLFLEENLTQRITMLL